MQSSALQHFADKIILTVCPFVLELAGAQRPQGSDSTRLVGPARVVVPGPSFSEYRRTQLTVGSREPSFERRQKLLPAFTSWGTRTPVAKGGWVVAWSPSATGCEDRTGAASLERGRTEY